MPLKHRQLISPKTLLDLTCNSDTIEPRTMRLICHGLKLDYDETYKTSIIGNPTLHLIIKERVRDTRYRKNGK